MNTNEVILEASLTLFLLSRFKRLIKRRIAQVRADAWLDGFARGQQYAAAAEAPEAAR